MIICMENCDESEEHIIITFDHYFADIASFAYLNAQLFALLQMSIINYSAYLQTPKLHYDLIQVPTNFHPHFSTV